MEQKTILLPTVNLFLALLESRKEVWLQHGSVTNPLDLCPERISSLSMKTSMGKTIVSLLYLSPEKMSGLSMGQTTISLTVALANSSPAISSQATGVPCKTSSLGITVSVVEPYDFFEKRLWLRPFQKTALAPGIIIRLPQLPLRLPLPITGAEQI